MSIKERTGTRDLTYSAWHRQDNLRRFIGRMSADAMTMIDIDACEYCRDCYTPLALIETQHSCNGPKSARVTQQLASMAGITAWSVSYVTDDGDITGFQVRRLAPTVSTVHALTPLGYGRFLFSLRDDHHCPGWDRRRAIIINGAVA